jgi:glycosyltransferase involved in cell wall biosynthesis
MRILHISTRLILGGSQENTLLSCEGQARRGHRVHLAFGPIYGPEGSLLSRIEAFNARVASGEERTVDGLSNTACTPIITHIIPDMVRELNIIKDRRAYHQLRALIGRLIPDVVHTHSSKAGILGRFAAWNVLHHPPGGLTVMNRTPAGPIPRIIHTIHGPPFMPVEGNLVNKTKLRTLNYIYTLAERAAARRCHHIVSVANSMTSQFLSRGIGTPDLYSTIYSGMETAPFLDAPRTRPIARRELGIESHHTVIATVARLAQHKGHDDVLEALAPDLRSRPELKLLWIGDGWWRERLTQHAARLGLTVSDCTISSQHNHNITKGAANILLTGLVPPERVPHYLSAADILAHPSYREGLPRTVPQALLCGICPIAYDVDGTGEICRDMETGRLVSPGSIDKLREALLWAIDNPLARTALAHRGREECIVKFTADRMVNDLCRLYSSPSSQ